jgi:two-component system, sensor histidine kinase
MTRRRNVRAILARTFVASALVPFLLLGGWGLYYAQGEWRREVERLNEVAVEAQRDLDEHLSSHRIALETLAAQLRLAGTPMDTSVTAWLDALHQRRPGFITMAAIDASAAVVAAVPQHVSGLDVSDREYFRRIAAGDASYVSGAFRGRGLGTAPIVSVAARVEDAEGRFRGIVQGAIRVDRFALLEQRFTSMHELRVVVLDSDGTVVYGGRDGRFESLQQLDPTRFEQPPGRATHIQHDRGGDGRRWVVSTASSRDSGWRVIVMQPFRVALHDLQVFLAGLVIAAIWSLFIMAMAVRRVGRAVEPLEQLAAAMHDFSPAAPGTRFTIAEDAPVEVADLARGFDAMAERTHLVITGLVPICALCKRIRTESDEWEPVESFVRARSEAEFTHGMCPTCSDTLGFPQTIPPAGAAAPAAPAEDEGRDPTDAPGA